jgi:hypothetical protein
MAVMRKRVLTVRRVVEYQIAMGNGVPPQELKIAGHLISGS